MNGEVETTMQITKKKYYKEFGLLILILLILFVSFRYNDLKYILFYEHSLLNNIINYKSLNFYQYCLEQYNQYGFEAGACYALWGMPMYLILGIWGIPIYAASTILDTSVYEMIKNAGVVIYGKSIVLIFLLLTLALTLKYFDKCQNKNIDKQQFSLLFLSSYMAVAPVFIQGQCDIIEVFFAVAGIYFLTVKNNKKVFLLSFIIAVSLKQMSILIFIPIILLTEKKIWKILANIGGMLIFPVINKVFLGGPIDYAENTSNIAVILENKLPILGGDIPVFLLFYAGICLWAYLYNEENEKKQINWIWMMGLLVYGGLNIFSKQIYRCVWVVPFLILGMAIVQNKNYKKIIAIETIVEWCYAFWQICKYSWCFDINNCRYMLPELFGKISEDDNLIQLSDFAGLFVSMKLDMVVGTIMIAFIILLIYILIKYRDKSFEIPFLENMEMRGILTVRILGIGLIGLIPIILYFLNLMVSAR